MKRVVLYTMEKCPHCQTAKRYLDAQRIAYRLCNVKTAKGQKEFASTGMRGVPVLNIGGPIIKWFFCKGISKYL